MGINMIDAIETRCPMRVSLVGGSTDLQDFINEYGQGSVISFPINKFTYITLSVSSKYNIDYSKKEFGIENPEEIKNDIAREVIQYFDLPPVRIEFDSDLDMKTGNGLATSSAYLLALLKAVDIFTHGNLSQYDLCKLAIKIERKFNPFVGYQDAFGCGLPGLKRLDFYKNGVEFKPLDDTAFSKIDMHIVPTFIHRNSTPVLESLDLESRHPLLRYVDELEKNIQNPESILDSINKNWIQKKRTSEQILNEELKKIDEQYTSDPNILAHKLVGAGGGGHWAIFVEKDRTLAPYIYDYLRKSAEQAGVEIPDPVKIEIDKQGLCEI